MAKVTTNHSSLVIEIADPAELERLMVVLTRSKSTKIAALREAIKEAVVTAAVDEVATDKVVNKMLFEIEEHLATEA